MGWRDAIANAGRQANAAAEDIKETSYHARTLIGRAIDLFDDFRELGYVEIQLGHRKWPIRLPLPKRE